MKKKKKLKISFSQRMIMNKNYISLLQKKIDDGIIPKMEKFCVKDNENENENKEPILFNSVVKNNYYAKLVKSMSQKFINNKDKSYAYSNQLSSFFPLVEPYRNDKYYEEMEKIKKWICKKDFNRFSQPERDNSRVYQTSGRRYYQKNALRPCQNRRARTHYKRPCYSPCPR